MFTISDDFGTGFLRNVKARLSDDDFFPVRSNFDAYADLNYSLEQVLAPLEIELFPQPKQVRWHEKLMYSKAKNDQCDALSLEDINEAFSQDEIASYQWSINESVGYAGLIQCSSWAKTYLAALYIYCSRLDPSEDVESDYLYAIVEDALAGNCTECSDLFVNFIEWLYDHVPPSPDYDDYFTLLTWLLLRRLRGGTTEVQFNTVKNKLLSRKYTPTQISTLTVCKRDAAAWFELHKRIPLRYGASNEDFETIILGVE